MSFIYFIRSSNCAPPCTPMKSSCSTCCSCTGWRSDIKQFFIDMNDNSSRFYWPGACAADKRGKHTSHPQAPAPLESCVPQPRPAAHCASLKSNVQGLCGTRVSSTVHFSILMFNILLTEFNWCHYAEARHGVHVLPTRFWRAGGGAAQTCKSWPMLPSSS